MYLNDEPPIAGGRELWGFPKKLASPSLRVEVDTLVGTLDYGGGAHRHRHHGLQAQGDRPRHRAETGSRSRTSCSRSSRMSTARPRICELVEYCLEDIDIKGAWTGPAALELHPHALAPVAELPVLEILSAMHILADLTLGLGKVVYDYLEDDKERFA